VHPHLSRSRRYRLLGFIPLGLVVVAAGAFVYVSQSPQSPFDPKLTPISVAQALARYRAHPGPVHPDIDQPAAESFAASRSIAGFTPPAPGVYTYATTGGDWVEYGGQKYNRPFPSTTAATVRRGPGCAWELNFQAAKEYSDGHVQCSAPGEFLCLAHLQDITFGDVSRQMTHLCHPAMIQVGAGADRAGGQSRTVCHASGHNPSTIAITFKETTTVTVGGQSRRAYHVVLDSSVDGDVNGTAVADVWFDAETGTYLKMVRKQDTYVDLPGKDRVYYRVRVTYQLQSLTPQT
jgi:hypothetical protein